MLVEIGLGDREATLVHGCGEDGPAGVAVRPLDPPVETPGHLLVRDEVGRGCLAALVAAFG